MPRRIFILAGFSCLAVLFAMIPTMAADQPDKAGEEFFERKIRPLLAERCFSCHARGQKKGGLSLDSRERLLAGGENGAVVVPGKPDESLLLRAVAREGEIQMPPDETLSGLEIAALKHWVSLGLPWPAHNADAAGTIRNDSQVTDRDREFWSFQPVRSFSPPAVQRTDWPRRELDYFVLSRLEAENMQPVAEADRPTLIRRATLDLLGLPPTAEEVEAFLADARADAYEQLLERLLASPRYGERWARHWLDVARYAEDQAHTFAARLYPSGYRYRDWVIDSLNRDLPFDQFLIEQIAGDLLAGDERTSRLPALGFFALGPVYYADAGCAPKAKADEYDDRIDTLSRGVLGLTVSCARCHDHKFDPISTQDYYALAGVFASTEYFEAPLASVEVVQRYDSAQARIKEAEQQLKESQADEARQVGESFAPQAAKYLVIAWRVLNRRKVDAGYKVASAIEGSELQEFLVDRWLAFLASDAAKTAPPLAPWYELLVGQDAQQDLSADAAAVAAVEGAAERVQSLVVAAVAKRRELDALYREQLAAIKEGEKKPEKPSPEKETAALLKEFVDSKDAPLALPKPQVDKLLPDDRKQFLAKRQSEFDELKKSAPPKYPFAHSLADGKAANLQVHLRGNVKDLGEEVPRRFLTVLTPAEAKPFQQGSGRLELAQAIASRKNPLTARVFVNRVWQQHFGRGLVGTPSNFGLLGERPTHPELLDYLAARFMDSGWSVKDLHREIMRSATYRLAATSTSANHERDPDNRLLWRMNRRRLDVEAWRDAMLASSGNLDLLLGGPSVDLNNTQQGRRTLYGIVSRHELNSMLRLFDFPDPNLTSERRVITTVPMQQLFTLNSEFMIRQSKSLVGRLEREQFVDDDSRIDHLYRWVLGRAARDRERKLAGEFLAKSLPAGVSATEVKLTRWEQLAQALLSTNEFVFVD